MQWYSSIGSLLFHRVLVTIASHFLNSPPKPYMQWYSAIGSLLFHRVLVTIANHFLNFPAQSPTCNGTPPLAASSFIEFLVTIASHFLNFPAQRIHAMVFLNAHPSLERVLVMIESHFLNSPPSPTCNSSPQCKSFPFIEFLSRLQVIFETSPPKPYMQ